MSTEVAAMEAVFDRIRTLVLSPVHPIAWPDLAFTPPANGRWLRVTHIPGPRVALTSADGLDDLAGAVQVDVFAPIGIGESAIRSTAATVRAHLKRGTTLFRSGRKVFLPQTQIGPLIRDEQRAMVPVIIRYQVLGTD